MAKVARSFSEDFEKCVAFHGHICPGLAIGFQAARVLMERLGVQRAGDEELLAFVENDACGADGIQVMTGCTFGKGNFIFKNFGKHAFTLVARKRGKPSAYASGLMGLRLPPSTVPSPKRYRRMKHRGKKEHGSENSKESEIKRSSIPTPGRSSKLKKFHSIFPPRPGLANVDPVISVESQAT